MTLSPVEYNEVLNQLNLANDEQLKHIIEWIISPMVTPKPAGIMVKKLVEGE